MLGVIILSLKTESTGTVAYLCFGGRIVGLVLKLILRVQKQLQLTGMAY